MIVTLLRQQGHTGGSGAALAKELKISHAGPDSARRCAEGRYVINFGVTKEPTWQQRRIQYSNTPASVRNCVNKLRTLQLLQRAGVQCLEFTEDRRTLNGWLETDGKLIARTVLNGHSGQGIVVVRQAPIPAAPLYTRYFKKDVEYRVHVAFGAVILIQQKKRGDNYNGDDRDRALIRTNDNGWVFCINDLDCNAKNYRRTIETLALNAAQAVGINHGAVDILVKTPNRGNVSAIVCEINSAPALRNPSTIGAYVGAFQKHLRTIRD